MTDRDKLLKLYKDLKNIEIPKLSGDIEFISNTLKQGIDVILDWLKYVANKHFNNK